MAPTCDNEKTNTGNFNGACILFEEEILKDFLRLMCRHHIYEIILKCICQYLFPSDSPSNVFHGILVEEWAELKKKNFPFSGLNEEGEELLELEGDQYLVFDQLKERALLELRGHSNNLFIRDDYKEITTMCLLFLTDRPKTITKSNQVQFYALQKPSHARFMASAIQAIKCFLFRYELNWDTDERDQILKRLPRFCMFFGFNIRKVLEPK